MTGPPTNQCVFNGLFQTDMCFTLLYAPRFHQHRVLGFLTRRKQDDRAGNHTVDTILQSSIFDLDPNP